MKCKEKLTIPINRGFWGRRSEICLQKNSKINILGRGGTRRGAKIAKIHPSQNLPVKHPMKRFSYKPRTQCKTTVNFGQILIRKFFSIFKI